MSAKPSLRLGGVRIVAACVAALSASFLAPKPARALEGFGYDVTTNTVDFTDITGLLGANTFYSHGFTGTSSIVANIEAGLIWDGHQSLTGVTTVIPNSELPGNGQFDMHATWVGSAIAGNATDPAQNGIAPGTQLWTGAIATSWASSGAGQYSGSFNVDPASLINPYVEAMLTGVNGKTADVLTSSWGFGNDDSQGGATALVLAMDSLVAQSHKTMIFSAGNSGPATNTIFQPASGNNFIDVGATSDQTPGYNTVASFSSVSPSDYFLPEVPDGSVGVTFPGFRAMVDLVAPGVDLDLAHYGGATGGNVFGGPTDSFPNNYNIFLSGTSFAAPIVAGGASLLVDAGKNLYPTDPNAIDGRVIKAVLMNSAAQLPGYNNGQHINGNGFLETQQSLDYSQGAGQLNLAQAWPQYTAGTHDVPTPAQGTLAPVQNIGWTFGTIVHASSESDKDYLLTTPLTAGTTITATLTWFSNDLYDTTVPADFNVAYGDFDDLDLQVLESDGTQPTKLIADSDSFFNSVEHLSFQVPDNSLYIVRVLEDTFTYNFDGATNTDFALAWSTAVPEPASLGIVLGGGALLLMRRRRKSVS